MTGQVLRSHNERELVYNGAMPLPASLVASIVSAVIEAAVQSSTATPAQYEIYTTTRTLPPEAKVGVMKPPQGDGSLVIDGKSYPIGAAAQFRSQQNRIVMPQSIQDTKDVVYVTDASGAIYRVWMLSPTELSALPKN
jgi:hypothetical protein